MPPEDAIEILAVGDLQLMTREPAPDLFDDVTTRLGAANITFGNCEWPYAEEAGDTHPVEAHINDDFDGGDLFAPGHPDCLRLIAHAGFDVMSVANNHTMHGGYRAFGRTIEILKENGIAPVGGGVNIDAARVPAMLERDGTTIAFLACTSSFLPGAHAGRRTPGIVPLRHHSYAENESWRDWGVQPKRRTLVNREDLASLVETVKSVRQSADCVVLSCHWGILEHESAIADFQREAARVLIDAGVDLIVSQGPLPIKGYEIYRGKAIFYNLGKFAMISPWQRSETPSGIDAPMLDETSRGLAVSATLADGKIAGLRLMPVYLGSDGKPRFPEEGSEIFSAILATAQERTLAAGLNGKIDAAGHVLLP